MRVLALLTDCFGGRGGIAQYNRDFVTALSVAPTISEVVVLPRLGDARDEAVPHKVEQLPAYPSRLRYSLEAASLARWRGPFDVLFCGHPYLSPLAAELSRWLRLPLWIQVHGIDAWERPPRYQQRSFERADLVTAVSRYTRKRVLEWADIHPCRIKVLPNTLRFPIRARDETARAPDHLPFAGKPYLITVSRINKEDTYKGHRRIIAVLARLIARHPDLQYVIVGEGDDRGALEALVADLGLAGHVHFLGHVSTELLQQLLAPARVFAMPSTKEGFGIVFLEAAACGLPVVAGNLDGSVDALAEGAIGTLVDPNDPDALCEALDRAVSGRAPAPDVAALQRFAAGNFQKHVGALAERFATRRAAATVKRSFEHPIAREVS